MEVGNRESMWWTGILPQYWGAFFTSRVRWVFFFKKWRRKKPLMAVTQIVLFIYLFIYQKTIYWIFNNAVGVGGSRGNWESWRDSINLWLYSEAELFPKDSSKTSRTILSWTMIWHPILMTLKEKYKESRRKHGWNDNTLCFPIITHLNHPSVD